MNKTNKNTANTNVTTVREAWNILKTELKATVTEKKSRKAALIKNVDTQWKEYRTWSKNEYKNKRAEIIKQIEQLHAALKATVTEKKSRKAALIKNVDTQWKEYRTWVKEDYKSTRSAAIKKFEDTKAAIKNAKKADKKEADKKEENQPTAKKPTAKKQPTKKQPTVETAVTEAPTVTEAVAA